MVLEMDSLQVPFNKPPRTGNEDQYVMSAIRGARMAGDGPFMHQCNAWFEERLTGSRVLMTPSCTHALEMAAILLNLQPGDEVIMPSYTFVSTANAFVLRGARVVFVDIRPDTMNIDEQRIEDAITPKTKVIVAMHYAGVACDMDAIMAIARRHGIFVVEDAAQAMMASYRGRPLGAIGHIGAYSFHETKNYTSGGEGGLLILNDSGLVERAEIVREKGTNCSNFLRGVVDRYSWVDVGSSYLPSELQAAYLWGQLERAEDIMSSRLDIWDLYSERLMGLVREGLIDVQGIPEDYTHNGHMFYLKTAGLRERDGLIRFLKGRGIGSASHYVPLHSAQAGLMYGRFHGEDRFTTSESERLVRLPLWFGMSQRQVNHVVDAVVDFLFMRETWSIYR